MWGGVFGIVMAFSVNLSFGSLVACARLCMFVILVGVVVSDDEIGELIVWLGIRMRFGGWAHESGCSV